MGLKGSGPYFQWSMSNTVLTDLVYHICELYIDDVLIHGGDPTTFLANARKVFSRLREFNVAVNPKKTKLGLEEVEYVGHVVSATRISFTPEKRLKVLNFPARRHKKHFYNLLTLPITSVIMCRTWRRWPSLSGIWSHFANTKAVAPYNNSTHEPYPVAYLQKDFECSQLKEGTLGPGHLQKASPRPFHHGQGYSPRSHRTTDGGCSWQQVHPSPHRCFLPMGWAIPHQDDHRFGISILHATSLQTLWCTRGRSHRLRHSLPQRAHRRVASGRRHGAITHDNLLQGGEVG